MAAINYRRLNKKRTLGRDPQRAPIQDILRDSARAIQFLRANAKEFNIDKERIASFGESAGGGTSLWLATHADLADPDSDDPVLRESSRLAAAGMLNGQCTYDLMQWPEEIGFPSMEETVHRDFYMFFGASTREELDTEKGRHFAQPLNSVGRRQYRCHFRN